MTKIITRSNYDTNTDVYSVEIACKYDVNLKSTLHLLRIWYLSKSTNPVYIYFRFALCGKIMFAFWKKSKQTCCKSIGMHHCFPTFTQTTSKNFRVRFTHVTCSNIYFWTKFALLPNNQICECFLTFAFGILIVFVLMRDERSKRHLFEVTMST